VFIFLLSFAIDAFSTIRTDEYIWLKNSFPIVLPRSTKSECVSFSSSMYMLRLECTLASKKDYTNRELSLMQLRLTGRWQQIVSDNPDEVIQEMYSYLDSEQAIERDMLPTSVIVEYLLFEERDDRCRSPISSLTYVRKRYLPKMHERCWHSSPALNHLWNCTPKKGEEIRMSRSPHASPVMISIDSRSPRMMMAGW